MSCNRMNIRALSGAGLAALALVLAACSTTKPMPDLPPTDAGPPPETISPQPLGPLPTGALSAAQITKALAERTYIYAAPGRKGTMTFYNDGTMSYQEAGKGEGTGLWQAADGKLCQALNPTSFLPKGTPSVCNPISSDGTRFTTGTMQLTPS
jgi:hypothetical protein